MKFRFTNTKDLIINAVKDAEKFIKIIAFQFTSKEFVEYLIEKSKLGLDIELITLPEDSFSKQDERAKIQKFFTNLKGSGVKIQLCDWEVGDPTLTSTSMSGDLKEGGGDKWYSLHGKLLITDKTAMIMSFNFIDSNLYESYLFSEDGKIITKFLETFEKCKDLFTKPTKVQDFKGTLIDIIDNDERKNILENFNRTHRKLIKQYSPNITPEIKLSPGLYVSPFDGRLRNILYELIDISEEFLYIVSERLFDDDFVNYIGKKIVNNEKTNIKILTGPPQIVRQNIQKATQEFRQIKVFGGEIRALENLHAKFWLNEKYLIVTSANLAKMNLGFKKGNDYWRANTEFFYIEDNQEYIESAKKEFEKVYNNSKTIEETLAESNQARNKSKEYFDLFNAKSRTDAKILLGKFRLKFTIDTEKNLIKIAKYASILAHNDDSTYIEKNHVIMGGILLILQKRASTLREINENLIEICSESEISNSIKELTKKKLTELEKEVYHINIEKLLLLRPQKNHKNNDLNKFL